MEWTFKGQGQKSVSIKYLHLYFEGEQKLYGFGKTRGRVNDDSFHFWVN